MSDKIILNDNKKNIYNDKRSYHVHLPKDSKRTLRPNEWFKLVFGLVCLLVFVSLTFILTQQREIPSFSSFIDLLRYVPSIDIDYFVVSDDILSWLRPLSIGELPDWLSFASNVLGWINGIILGVKGFLTWLLLPLDVVVWVGACIIQLLLYLFYFIGYMGLGLA